MSEPGPEHDPYTIRPGDPHPGTPPQTASSEDRADDDGRQDAPSPTAGGDGRKRIDPEKLRKVRRLILLSATASITSVFLPPVGLTIGVLTAIMVWRWWKPLTRSGMTRMTPAVVVSGTVFAIVVGTIGTVLAAVFASELAEYTSCQTGANTHIAQDKCWATFTDAIESRLPGG